MTLPNVVDALAFNVYGTLSGFDIVVIVRKFSQYEMAQEIAQKAFDDWFDDEETDKTMTEYIFERLNENDIETRVYDLCCEREY